MVGTLTRMIPLFIPLLAIWFLFLSQESLFAKLRLAATVIDDPDHQARIDHVRTKENFSWERIVPTEELIWTDCYSENQCARLKVPLDYAHLDGPSAAIAMLRVHSQVPHDATNYRGPILINPGGPGGSGVDFVAERGAALSTTVGPEFDVIGFDPRGIGRSTPRAAYFDNRAERAIWGDAQLVSINASADGLARAWARGTVEGQLVGERDDGTLPFINTDHTARDMLRIVQAHTREKIQYWGFSYGSVLGATFASMFPDNVGRLVIDGVVDSENYFATEWSNNLLDTEKVWMAFVDGCVAAGPEGCAFFAPTAAEILGNVEKIYASLRARPIPGPLFAICEVPIPGAGPGRFVRRKRDRTFKMSEIPPFECACDPAEYRFELVRDAGHAVACNDGKRISPEYESVVEHYDNLRKTSSWADMWEFIRMPCLSWPDFPKDHFQGPFIANTSFPLLLVGNTMDPVTPLWAAKKMSQGFAGSVVLTQDSVGHCSLSGPSVCTHKHIRNYFLDGKLPPPGTVCPVITGPFPGGDLRAEADAQAVLSMSAEDRALLDTVRELATTFDVRFPGGL